MISRRMIVNGSDIGTVRYEIYPIPWASATKVEARTKSREVTPKRRRGS